jgi:hypothetical protein
MGTLGTLSSLLITKSYFIPHNDNSAYNENSINENSIISFESPYPAGNLSVPRSNFKAVHDHPIDHERFHIRLVNSSGQREAASLLIKKKYSWRGYFIDSPLDFQPDRISLLAETRGTPVGTMTLCLDKSIGLPADENFGDKLDKLRAQGRRLSEPSKLAIDDNVPKRVFASLIHISYIYAHKIHGLTDWVIEVNPRHARFYKKMLGFEQMGEERICTRVNAPAVLLRLKLEYMAEQIKKFGGLMEQHTQERSFYPYFFPISDEYGIAQSLRLRSN